MSALTALLSSRSFRISLALSLLVIVITAAALLLIRDMKQTTAASLDQTASLAKALAEKILAPTKIIIEGKTVVEHQGSIAQLATAETSLRESYAIRTTWLGSEKSFHVRALFTGKAGYDLQHEMVIDLAADGSRATVTMPPATLLSVEESELEILEDESGYWNRLDAAQRQQALAELRKKARASLLETGILSQAQASLEKQFSEVLHQQLPAGLKLDFLVSP